MKRKEKPISGRPNTHIKRKGRPNPIDHFK